jgi:hypothetical protein
MVPCRNSVGPSTATPPATTRLPLVPLAAKATTADEGGDAARPGERELDAGADPARGERLDEHPGDGGAEDDQHRRQRRVLEVGGVMGAS